MDGLPRLTAKIDPDVYLERLGIGDDLGMRDGEAAAHAHRVAEVEGALAACPARVRTNAAVRAALDCFGGEVVSVRARPTQVSEEKTESNGGQHEAGDGAVTQPIERSRADRASPAPAKLVSPSETKAEPIKVEVRAVGQQQAAALWADVLANNKNTM
jgi:hypothetical protein